MPLRRDNGTGTSDAGQACLVDCDVRQFAVDDPAAVKGLMRHSAIAGAPHQVLRLASRQPDDGVTAVAVRPRTAAELVRLVPAGADRQFSPPDRLPGRVVEPRRAPVVVASWVLVAV